MCAWKLSASHVVNLLIVVAILAQSTQMQCIMTAYDRPNGLWSRASISNKGTYDHCILWIIMPVARRYDVQRETPGRHCWVAVQYMMERECVLNNSPFSEVGQGACTYRQSSSRTPWRGVRSVPAPSPLISWPLTYVNVVPSDYVLSI